jgi:hypothetical protein
MTARSPVPLERLYVSDDELAQMGVDEKSLGVAIIMLDANPKSGFPKKDPLFGNRRYWPNVRDWFDDYNRRKRPQDRNSVLQFDCKTETRVYDKPRERPGRLPAEIRRIGQGTSPPNRDQ